MTRALALASMGLGKVSPNPMVGCVVTCEDSVVAEGWHQSYGGAHAEVNALSQVQDHSILSRSTLYVNLEPCNHYGKTPPCSDLIISKRVRRVVIGSSDPNPIAGGGIKKIAQAGIEVSRGVLKNECHEFNRRFFLRFERARPYIILKWAQTKDGFIARSNYESKWISGPESRKLVHKWRSEEDAVLVGTNTANYDDPTLDVRDWTGRNPVRIVIDRNLRLSPELKLFDQSQQTICFNTLRDYHQNNLEFVKLDPKNFLAGMMSDLSRRGILSVLVEGGTSLLQELIKVQLWDEIRLFQSPVVFGEGIPAPRFSAKLEEDMNVNQDKLHVYSPNSE